MIKLAFYEHIYVFLKYIYTTIRLLPDHYHRNFLSQSLFLHHTVTQIAKN